MFVVVKGTEITVRQVPGNTAASNNYSSTKILAIDYVLPTGYTLVMAIPYTPTWFAQVSLQSITDSKVNITVYNGYGAVQDIIAGAYVLVVKNNL